MALDKNDIRKSHQLYAPPQKLHYNSNQSQSSINENIQRKAQKKNTQVKSINTHDSKNQTESGRFKKNSTGMISYKYPQSTPNFSPELKSVHHIRQLKLKNNPNKNKKHGYIYNSTSYIPNHSTDSQESEINKIQDENTRLRAKLVDCELRQRENVEKINELQKLCLSLEQIIAKRKTMTKQQQQFLNVLKSTYLECFGIQQYKQIWEMQKMILHEWMSSKIQQTQTVQTKIRKKTSQSSKILNYQPEQQQPHNQITSNKNIRIKINSNSHARIKTEQEILSNDNQ